MGQWACLKRLLAAGAAANCASSADPPKHTALHFAVHEDSVEGMSALLCAGANVEKEIRGDWTPLQVAVRECRLAAVALLLAAGADARRVCAQDVRRFGMATIHRQMSMLIAAGSTLRADELASSPEERAAIEARVPLAKRQIQRAGFAAIRGRVLEICVALQELQLPAPVHTEILEHACAPFAARLPFHLLWDAVVLIKHFHLS